MSHTEPSSPDVGAPLRRLLRRMTLLYLMVGVAAIVPLGVLVVRADAHQRAVRLDAALEIRADAAAALVYFAGRRLDVAALRRDAVSHGTPQLMVLLGVPPTRPVFETTRPPLRVSHDNLIEVATRAVDTRDTARGTATDASGRTLRLLAVPVYREDGRPGAAVVTVADPAAGAAAHRKLIVALGLAGGGVLLVALTGGYLLGRRGLRPAEVALARQQVFLDDAARKLREPAIALRELAETARANPAAQAETLPRADWLASRMIDAVDDLTLRAQLACGSYPLTRTATRLDRLVEDAVTSAGGHRVAVTTRPCTVMADRHLIGRAVANLVDNALRHGHLPDTLAEVTVTVDGDGTVSVTDRGPGLPVDVAAALTAAVPAEPLGAGLSIAAWAARLHHTDLTARPAARGGVTLALRLQPEGAGLVADPPRSPEPQEAAR